MRAAAEAKMRQLGYWGSAPLPIAVYTMGRYISSEVGSGTPEEKVAVAEAALHRAEKRGISANDLLLYPQAGGHPNRGYYGPINVCATRAADGSCAKLTAPYGRWASTSKDPGVDDLLIAEFVLSGRSSNFSKGADTQYGMEYLSDPIGKVRTLAAKGTYWVGPLPGVDHWHTFLIAERPDISPQSVQGQALLQRGVQALSSSARPDWSALAVCPTGPKMPIPVFVGLALAASLGLAYAMAVYVEPTWRDKPWMSRGM